MWRKLSWQCLQRSRKGMPEKFLIFSSSEKGSPDGIWASDVQQSWESGSPGEEALQSSSDERPATSAAATAAEEQMLFDVKA